MDTQRDNCVRPSERVQRFTRTRTSGSTRKFSSSGFSGYANLVSYSRL